MTNSKKIKVFDLHVHLRDEPKKHIKFLKDAGYYSAVAMANTAQPLDTVERVKAYKNRCKNKDVAIYQISALTLGLEGRKLVDIGKIKSEVVGFSDDGKSTRNMELVEEALGYDILIMAHLEPEIEYLKKSIGALRKIGKGRIHFQHITKKESVDIIRKAKKERLEITAETCPHYLYLSSVIDDLAVNLPLGNGEDQKALIEGVQDGTIDCIASDYAPLPRKTGFAGASTFYPLCLGLVERGIITNRRLEELIYLNPQKIILPKT